MCGIIFAYSHDPKLVDSISDTAALKGIKHRGPDGQRVVRPHSGVLIGHTRLAIRGVTTGQQPFIDKKVITVVNGEIYNYRSLLKESKSIRGDCEVLHLFALNKNAEELHESLGRIQGMFAWLAYYPETNLLFTAIDTFGQKPLYKYEDQNILIYSSEISGIRLLLDEIGISLLPNPQDYSQYLLHGWMSCEKTGWKNVTYQNRGTYHWHMLKEGMFQKRSYFSFGSRLKLSSSEEASEFLKNELRRYARAAFDSEVSVALGLSSGLDSSYIGCLAKDCTEQDIHAISLGYDLVHDGDEANAAHMFASGINLKCRRIQASTDHFVGDYLTTTALMQEPVVDFASQFYSKIYKSAALDCGFKVILMGHGADEISIGYGWMHKALNIALKRSSFCLYEVLDDFRIYYRSLKQFSSLQADIYPEIDFKSSLKNKEEYAINLVSAVCDSWLQCSSLKMADRLSMGHGIECRSPLLNEVLMTELGSLYRLLPNSMDCQKGLYKIAYSTKIDQAMLEAEKKYFSPPRLPLYNRLRTFMRNKYSSNQSVAEDLGIIRAGTMNYLLNHASDSCTYYWFNKIMRLELSLLHSLDPVSFQILLEQA